MCFDQQRLFSSFSDFDEEHHLISEDLKSDCSGKGFDKEGGKGSIIIIGGSISERRVCGHVDNSRKWQQYFANHSRKFNRRTSSTVTRLCALAPKAAVSAAPQAA